jgi:hypothetical protein
MYLEAASGSCQAASNPGTLAHDLEVLLHKNFENAPRGFRNQVKSRVTPRGNMKAARSLNHRGLPGGGGL